MDAITIAETARRDVVQREAQELLDLLSRTRHEQIEQLEQLERTITIWRRVQDGEDVPRHDWLWRVDETFRVGAYAARAAAGYGLKLFYPDWPDGMSAADWRRELSAFE